MTSDMTTIDAQSNYTVSKFNAVRHGILSRHTIMPWEEKNDYESLIAALETEYTPQGMTEQHLVEELAGVIWRKARLRGAEKAIHLKQLNYLLNHSYSDETPMNVVLISRAKNSTKQIDAFTATDKETADDLKRMHVLLNASYKALVILEKGAENAYDKAIEALDDEDSGVWPEWIGELVGSSSSQRFQATPASLTLWIKLNIQHYEQAISELKNRQAIKEQIIGQSFPSEKKMDNLSRYEVHLDRKFERTLTMLVKLQDIRKPVDSIPAH